MGSIGDRLGEILERLDGAEAAALVAGDGIAVETVSRNGDLDLELLMAELLTQVRAISGDQTELGVGDVRQFAVTTERYSILIGALEAGYYLLLVLGPSASYGRARFELRRAPLLFAEELG